MLKLIVSGGQTGADRAALDVAIELKIPHGGWCPKNRLAEDGVIGRMYELREASSGDYSERTKLNIRDSDGTWVFIHETPIQNSSGTLLTVLEAQKIGRPCHLVDLSKGLKIESVVDWTIKHHIKILNIAGPRESQCPGIYKITADFLRQALPLLCS